jgi:nucleotide-binding universal stress UspA family protein
MYKTILVPLDHTSSDETILAHVLLLARQMGSRLILIHVADGHVARNQEQLNLADSSEMCDDRAYLQRRQDELAAGQLSVTSHLATGDPTTEILSLADKEKCDLIAMATHGHGFIKDTLLGSVASQLRHRTSIPILMLRAAL